MKGSFIFFYLCMWQDDPTINLMFFRKKVKSKVGDVYQMSS